MKRLFITITSLLLLLLMVSSCGSMQMLSKKKLMSIQHGMTQQEISSILGLPDSRRFDEAFEEWEYQRLDDMLDSTVLIVRFEDGRVTGMENFRPQMPPPVVTPPAVIVPDCNPPRDYGYNNQQKGRKVMSPAEFERFHQHLKSGFSSDRMKKIRDALLVSRFTSQQCGVMVGLFSFSDEQIDFMETVYPSVADKQNFSVAMDKMSFGTDKNRIREYIDKYNNRR